MDATTNGLAAAEGTPWSDGKRYWWLLSPALPLIALFAVFGAIAGGPTLLLWVLPLVFYGIVPFLDWFIGEDRVNAPESAVAGLDQDAWYRRIVYLYLPTQYVLTAAGAWYAVQGGLVWWELIGLILSVGMINGVGINTAHELGHKTNSLERWLAKITLAPVAYGHFFVEHNKGHHKNVATPDDPASSKMGETFWAFLPRSVVGSAKSAWHIEADRLERLGKSAWSVGNENLQAWAMTVALFGGLSAWLGPWALAFLVAQAVYGFCLLEVVNYLEHYGLVRQKLADGRYERCQPRHSWNSNHVVTNLLLYQLQRHSDHHANPTRRYQALRHFDDSPQLPSGYAGMILIAYFPFLWFRQMDPLVAQHHGGDLTKANLHPAARARLLARYAPQMKPVVVHSADADNTAQPQPVLTAAQHQCPNCAFVYDENLGAPYEGYPAGTRWFDLPRDWTCPDCAVREKPDFVALAT